MSRSSKSVESCSLRKIPFLIPVSFPIESYSFHFSLRLIHLVDQQTCLQNINKLYPSSAIVTTTEKPAYLHSLYVIHH
jgi:hypothetical protein